MTSDHANLIKLRAAGKAIMLTEHMNATELHLPSAPDEVSMLFAHPNGLEGFRRWAVNQGIDNFASVEQDVCVCVGADWWNPEGNPSSYPTFEGPEVTPPVRPVESFAVRFEFLRIPGALWRIEAMCVLSGEAPLHEAWLELWGNGSVVHVSYKLPTRTDYDQHLRRGLHVSQWAGQPTFRASYANSYGRFGYYQHPNFGFGRGGSEWLLKPRVNERDTGPIASNNLEG